MITIKKLYIFFYYLFFTLKTHKAQPNLTGNMSSSALSLPAFETGSVSRSVWYLPHSWNVVIPFMIGWTNTKSIFHLGLRLWIFFTETNWCHTQSDEMRVCELNPAKPHLYLSTVKCDCWHALCSWGTNKQITAWPPCCHLCIWMQYFTWIQKQPEL